MYCDFCELLVCDDIDVVLIVMGDCWYGFVFMMVVWVGKDVYLEKFCVIMMDLLRRFVNIIDVMGCVF